MVVVNDSEYAVKMIITITNVSVMRCTHWRGNFYSIIYLTVSSVLELVLVLKSPGSELELKLDSVWCLPDSPKPD